MSHLIFCHWTYPDSGVGAADILARFAAMPADVVARTGGSIVGFAGGLQETLLVRDDRSGPCTAELSLSSGRAYFVRWRSRGLLTDEDIRAKFGFKVREFPVHGISDAAISEDEAVARVRLYFIGAGVDVSGVEYAARRSDQGWVVSISVGALDSSRQVFIGDDGVIGESR
ncbi:hypothetical protein JGU71_06880 [Antrihabitans sp. YC3-6]|uniref:Uncharacterized protein n=1 Tax=Antrihabitans stalagmiti TaxID=2799499 RepID=A0A934NNR0_9NOCA|nr:hypothetical protein [Antrihabitans stalagmiti]MBJ8338603.1 hypothetical protein [Antrihabitans stalagmiti]